jgi:hypothetical protein
MDFIFSIIGNSAFDDGISLFIYSGVFISMAVKLVFAYMAIFKTELITNRISKSNEGSIELITNKTDWLEIALASIGILAIVYSIPNILYSVVENVYFHDHRETVFWTRPTRNEMYQAVFQLVIGTFLLMNARNFAKLIVKRGKQDDEHDEKKRDKIV